jgi:hypothetical protein
MVSGPAGTHLPALPAAHGAARRSHFRHAAAELRRTGPRRRLARQAALKQGPPARRGRLLPRVARAARHAFRAARLAQARAAARDGLKRPSRRRPRCRARALPRCWRLRARPARRRVVRSREQRADHLACSAAHVSPCARVQCTQQLAEKQIKRLCTRDQHFTSSRAHATQFCIMRRRRRQQTCAITHRAARIRAPARVTMPRSSSRQSVLCSR